jgi:hypothetical protein
MPETELRPGCHWVEVESYKSARTGGLHGDVHIRPVVGGPFSPDLRVECADEMKRNHPVGTRFLIMAKLKTYGSGGQCLYTSWRWPYEVLG